MTPHSPCYPSPPGGPPAAPRREARGEPRQRVMDALLRHPGSMLSELQKLAHVGWPSLYEAIRELEASGKIRVEGMGRGRRYFPTHFPTAGVVRPLKGKTKRLVARTILEAGITNMPDVIAKTGLSRRIAYHHVKALRDAGLVDRDAFRRTLAATPKLKRALEGAAPAPAQSNEPADCGAE